MERHDSSVMLANRPTYWVPVRSNKSGFWSILVGIEALADPLCLAKAHLIGLAEKLICEASECLGTEGSQQKLGRRGPRALKRHTWVRKVVLLLLFSQISGPFGAPEKHM